MNLPSFPVAASCLFYVTTLIHVLTKEPICAPAHYKTAPEHLKNYRIIP
jgi:hypothetical protein